jgi:hypothetical protein
MKLSGHTPGNMFFDQIKFSESGRLTSTSKKFSGIPNEEMNYSKSENDPNADVDGLPKCHTGHIV